MLLTSSFLDTSALIAKALPPIVMISCTAVRAVSKLISLTTTVDPSLAKAKAIALPIPCPAPVTRLTLFSSLMPYSPSWGLPSAATRQLPHPNRSTFPSLSSCHIHLSEGYFRPIPFQILRQPYASKSVPPGY
ncbi:hypothetical protein ES703_42211 [subsurface metagenome]